MTERLPSPDTARFPGLRDAYVALLPVGTLLGRIFFSLGDHPARWNSFRHFGPTGLRFDHHAVPRRDRQERGIAYVATRRLRTSHEEQARAPQPLLRTCLAGVFRDRGTIDRVTGRPVFTLFRLAAPVRLLDLADSDWLTAAGGNAAISSGARERAREWSRAIYDHYGPALDGLYYSSSNIPPARSVALYEQAVGEFPLRPELVIELDSDKLAPELSRYAVELGCDLV